MNHFGLSSNLTWLTVLALLTLILAGRQRSSLITSFCLYMINIAAWSFGYSRMVLATNPISGLFWGRFLHVGAAFIPTMFFHFTLAFQTDKYAARWRNIVRLGYGLTAFFLIVCFSPLFIPSATYISWVGYYPVRGPLYNLFIAFFFGFVGLALWSLGKAYRESTGLRKTQIGYALVAYIIAYSSGAQVFLPYFGYRMFRYSLYGIPLCMCILCYAVLAHRLLDIRLVIRKTLIYSVVTALLTLIYLGVVLGLAWFSQEILKLSSVVSYAVAAGVITLLFDPLRRKIQRLVDRFFIRESLDQVLLREATNGFVHEIKRPLARIGLPTELCIADLQELNAGERSVSDVVPRVLQRLHFVLNQTTDAGNKIEAIREVSDLDGKSQDHLDLRKIIRHGLETEHELLQRHHIEVHADLGQEPLELRGNSRQLEIVAANLTKNAAEALSALAPGMPRNIEIKVLSSGETLTWIVKDSGPGIKSEHAKYLFEPYFTTKSRHGMGMGLFLCRQIIQGHGGTISVQSHDGGGAIFEIILSRR